MTKYATIPTSASSNKAIAITPTVRIGFDRRSSVGDTRALSAPMYDGIVGAEDLCVGKACGRISVAGAAAPRVIADSGVPSSRQNLNESSWYSWLHLGQRFMVTHARVADPVRTASGSDRISTRR